MNRKWKGFTIHQGQLVVSDDEEEEEEAFEGGKASDEDGVDCCRVDPETETDPGP